ncbi:glycosyltransferase [Pontibacter silvestris]|uniref:Glycosyltransferase n=1 Tax=Pontibacter silvestris TaxID=2305183 RepID=A0ABW4WXD6_9BACT|nr:glycosyltransferase [Pontibacter silvestris]MCC9137342.1 glycosyltransferase [Pontibacter silvestris]
MNSTTIEGFSIILCTYNGEKRLQPTLKHLSNLKYPPNVSLELILVNNASTDNTITTASEIWIRLGNPFPLRIITEKNQGKGYAIEAGYDNAAFPFIITVDDDNWLDESYILYILEILNSHPNVGLIGGYNIPVFEGEQPIWFNKLPHVAFAVGNQAEREGLLPTTKQNYLWGAGLVVKTSYWKDIRDKGFSFITSKNKGKAVGEDSELCIIFQNLGIPFYYSDKLVLKHYMPETRMSKNILNNMFQGFGKTDTYFELYRFINYEVKAKRKLGLISMYTSMVKDKTKQAISAKREFKSTSSLMAELNYIRRKSDLKELLMLAPRFRDVVHAIQHNLLITLS